MVTIKGFSLVGELTKNSDCGIGPKTTAWNVVACKEDTVIISVVLGGLASWACV